MIQRRVRSRALLLAPVLAVLSACGREPARCAAAPDASVAARTGTVTGGSGGGGSGLYTQCLCVPRLAAYLDLRLVGVADGVAQLRVDALYPAPGRSLPARVTAGSTLTQTLLGVGPEPGDAARRADFGPYNPERIGLVYASVLTASRAPELVLDTGLFGLLFEQTPGEWWLRVAALDPEGQPICDSFGDGRPAVPGLSVTRAELTAILQSHADPEAAFWACVTKLEETGGPAFLRISACDP
jgi:hypothetical protein